MAPQSITPHHASPHHQERFELRMQELRDLDGVLALLGWDEETYAPQGGRGARGQQTATLEAIRHQRLVDPELGDLIAKLEEQSDLPAEYRILLKRAKRKRELAVRVPESLVKATARARSRSLDAWQTARAKDDFPFFRPHLEEILSLARERADALGSPSGARYDALLDEHEPGSTVASLNPLLETLRRGLVPLVQTIVDSGKAPDRSFLEGKPFDAEVQWNLSLRLLRDLGFDFDHGRQDRSAHPFTTGIAEKDVRLTTRLFADNPLSAIFSTIHECGHALYEQGFDPAHHRTFLAAAPSMGIHESQSRLWENQIGRSRAFWGHYLPILRAAFPAQLSDVDLERFYRAVNTVKPTPVRVEADEVTYNLHILMRFELELALLESDLLPADLPEAWRQKLKQYLGIEPKNDTEGCLQDIHWAWGSIGYFPTYTLGNLYAAQLMRAFERRFAAAAWGDIERGDFSTLRRWLRESVHQKGHLKSASETVKDATGEEIGVQPFLDYLGGKYLELYR